MKWGLSIVAHAKWQGHLAKVESDTFVINGRRYSHDNIPHLPLNLSLESAKVISYGDRITFASRTAFLSNFHPSPIVMDGVTFTSAEQAFQFRKAQVAGDEVAANSIINCTDPLRIKRLGDEINLKPGSRWAEEFSLSVGFTPCRHLRPSSGQGEQVHHMTVVVKAKFSQNDSLHQQLLDTNTKTLIHATTCRFWGAVQSQPKFC